MGFLGAGSAHRELRGSAFHKAANPNPACMLPMAINSLSALGCRLGKEQIQPRETPPSSLPPPSQTHMLFLGEQPNKATPKGIRAHSTNSVQCWHQPRHPADRLGLCHHLPTLIQTQKPMASPNQLYPQMYTGLCF